MADFAAVYYDGETAHRAEVMVRFNPSGVVFINGEAPTWRYKDLRLVDRAGGKLRLAPEKTSLARLIIDDGEDAAAELRIKAKHLFGFQAARGAVTGVIVLAVVALGLVGGAVFGLPVVSGPLARATPPEAETQIGESYLSSLTRLWPTCEAAQEGAAAQALAALTDPIAEVSGAPFEIAPLVVDASFPNAFALPGGHVLITDELIAIMETPEELAGVIAHEIAHVERRHVMAAIIRQFGIAIAVDAVVSGGSGAGRELIMAGVDLTTFGHTRAAEEEADALAVDYLAEAGVDPEGLAVFFDVIGALFDDDDDADVEDFLRNLAKTHPDTDQRAADARARIAAMGDREYAPVIDDEAWAALKAACPATGDWSGDIDGADPAAEADQSDAP